MNEEMRQQIRSTLTPGTTIRLKSDLSISFRFYGINDEKKTFIGKECVYMGCDDNKIKIKRDPEKRKFYRSDCLYWSFHIDDIDLTSSHVGEKIIPESLFDIKNLDI